MSDVPTRLLRETLRGQMMSPPSGCITAETLARWSEGTLSARERAAAESHASGCLRCQALLAAMARLETSGPPTQTRRWWHASTIGWLVPIAVAAAAVLLWINVPGGRRAQSAASARASSTPVSTVHEPSTPSVDRPAESKDAERAQQRTAKADAPRTRTATGAVQSFAQRAEQANAARGVREPAVAPSSPTAPPAAAPSPEIAATEATRTPPSTADASPVASKPVRPARALTEQVVVTGAAAQLMSKTSAMPTVIVSPNANVRWRIVAGGNVERTTNGGISWEAQSTGVSSTLTAGAAPSATVCWLVGPGGLVVLSTDGLTWQRISFPEAIDLTSIRAADATNATVTAADGRTFTTTDGGTTWRPV
jgi:hypothetical protein